MGHGVLEKKGAPCVSTRIGIDGERNDNVVIYRQSYSYCSGVRIFQFRVGDVFRSHPATDPVGSGVVVCPRRVVSPFAPSGSVTVLELQALYTLN